MDGRPLDEMRDWREDHLADPFDDCEALEILEDVHVRGLDCEYCAHFPCVCRAISPKELRLAEHGYVGRRRKEGA